MMPPGRSQDARFVILFVCTANVCRSVMAERLAIRGLRARLGSGAARFAVASAGTACRAGAPMHPGTAATLTRLDADTSGFTSRQLTPAIVGDADLILAADLGHRAQAVAMNPRMSQHIFLLKEFARLAPFAAGPGAGAGGAGTARRVVTRAARFRGRIPYADPASDTIADPAVTGEPLLACAQVIEAALAEVLDALCGSSPERHDARAPAP